nr:TAXI family TRAP transporter solute-binding subunit [Dankookia rubra]
MGHTPGYTGGGRTPPHRGAGPVPDVPDQLPGRGAARERHHEFAHLDKRRVGCGPARGPAEIFFRAAADAAGITAEVISGEPAVQAEALAAGHIDAFWQGTVVPIPSLLLALGCADALVFGLRTPAVTALLPYLPPTTLPPGTYPGQVATIESFGAWNFIVANAALPEARAHDLTHRVLSARDPASEIHPSAAATRAANAGANRVLPFHSCAAQFYQEAGIALAI